MSLWMPLGGVLGDALMITGFVFAMMLLVEYLNVATAGLAARWLERGGLLGYAAVILVGTVPGCLGAFTDVVRPLADEMDPSPYGAASTQSFTDDFTLTGGSPTNHSRYYRVRVSP